jgi:hypothetical protein
MDRRAGCRGQAEGSIYSVSSAAVNMEAARGTKQRGQLRRAAAMPLAGDAAKFLFYGYGKGQCISQVFSITTATALLS